MEAWDGGAPRVVADYAEAYYSYICYGWPVDIFVYLRLVNTSVYDLIVGTEPRRKTGTLVLNYYVHVTTFCTKFTRSGRRKHVKRRSTVFLVWCVCVCLFVCVWLCVLARARVCASARPGCLTRHH